MRNESIAFSEARIADLQPLYLGYLQKKGVSLSSAYDILQDAYCVAILRLRDGRLNPDPEQVRAFMFATLYNLAMAHFTKASTAQTRLCRIDDYDTDADDSQRYANPTFLRAQAALFDEEERRELLDFRIDILHAALDDMHGTLHDILQYHYFDGLPMEEVALALDLSGADSAKSLNCRAKRQLRQLYQKHLMAA